jgi:hypothetical protein
MATGSVIIDFGAFPGGSDASVVVTGQTAILASSLVEAFLSPAATADHSADEHLVETLNVMAGNVVPGVGFTIYAVNTSQLNEPVTPGSVAGGGPGQVGSLNTMPSQGGQGTRIYGKWNVGWAWV